MLKGSKEREPKNNYLTLVALKNDKLGHEIKQRGKSYHLSKSFRDVLKSYNPSGECIYFRTEFDNIYRMDFYYGIVRLINAEECRIRGDINPIELSSEILSQQKLTIGKRFAYGDQGRITSPIVEIVVNTGKAFDPVQLREMTNGRSNAIIHDFEGRLPSKPTKPRPFPK